MPERRFVWIVHQPGVTRWLKRELAQRAPELRFAFSRPGLTTFKWAGASELPADYRLPSSFARAWGYSLGRTSDADELLELAAVLGAEPLRLHVFERDPERPIEDQPLRGHRAAQVHASLLERAPTRWSPSTHAQIGELVLDVIVPPPDDPNEPWLIGWHVHGPGHGPEPGGVAHVPPPPEAPSRAWSKIEEAIRWSELEPRAGETAVEIGAAPGGASLALLDRGLKVIGIDPGPIDPRVAARSSFVHLAKPFAEVERRELPARFEWLLLDVNLAPPVALRYVERLLALAGPSRRSAGEGGPHLRGAFLTLKLNDAKVVEGLPRLYERLTKLAGGSLSVTQLPSHRSEVLAVLAWPRSG